jgi:hypothetical protein
MKEDSKGLIDQFNLRPFYKIQLLLRKFYGKLKYKQMTIGFLKLDSHINNYCYPIIVINNKNKT